MFRVSTGFHFVRDDEGRDARPKYRSEYLRIPDEYRPEENLLYPTPFLAGWFVKRFAARNYLRDEEDLVVVTDELEHVLTPKAYWYLQERHPRLFHLVPGLLAQHAAANGMHGDLTRPRIPLCKSPVQLNFVDGICNCKASEQVPMAPKNECPFDLIAKHEKLVDHVLDSRKAKENSLKEKKDMAHPGTTKKGAPAKSKQIPQQMTILRSVYGSCVNHEKTNSSKANLAASLCHSYIHSLVFSLQQLSLSVGSVSDPYYRAFSVTRLNTLVAITRGLDQLLDVYSRDERNPEMNAFYRFFSKRRAYPCITGGLTFDALDDPLSKRQSEAFFACHPGSGRPLVGDGVGDTQPRNRKCGAFIPDPPPSSTSASTPARKPRKRKGETSEVRRSTRLKKNEDEHKSPGGRDPRR